MKAGDVVHLNGRRYEVLGVDINRQLINVRTLRNERWEYAWVQPSTLGVTL